MTIDAQTIAVKEFEPPHLPGYVVLCKHKNGNAYQAIVELSFSMSLSSDRACFFWSSDKATSNFGGSFKIDGKKNAEHHCEQFQRNHPDMEFQIYDVHEQDLPIVIDWDNWRWGSAPSDKKLSGVVDKMAARNPKFYMK